MANETVALSTVDNPFNYFDDFDSWYYFDEVVLHHGCCELLDRIAHTSDTLTDEENAIEIERAIDQIVSTDPLCIYIKVYNKRTSNESGNKV
jgi:hypothetical protein